MRALLAAAVLAAPATALAQQPSYAIVFDADATARYAAGEELREARPYLIVGGDAFAVPQACWPRQFGGDDEGRRFGGDDEGRRFGGDDEGRRFGGDDEGRRFGGDDEGRRFGGDDEGRRFGGDDEGRRFGGDDEGRRFGGDDEGRRFGGDDEGRRFGGDDEGRRFGGDDEGRRFGGALGELTCSMNDNGTLVTFEPPRSAYVVSRGVRYEIVNGLLRFD